MNDRGTPQVQDRSVTVQGLTFHYRDWGGQGIPAVLLHGLASSCRTWDLVAPLLARHFRVVALDQRGHGLSAKPDDGYDPATFAGDLDAILAALGLEQALLVGHSFGCRVVLEHGALYPHRSLGLVLLDGGVNSPGAHRKLAWEQVAQEMAPPDLTTYTPAQLVERVRSRSSQIPWSPEREAILLSLFEVTPQGTVQARLSRENHMQILRGMWDSPPAPRFPLVQCPVLIMPCRQPSDDPERLRSKDEGVQKALQALRRASCVWMEESVHDVQLQRPQLVAQAILDAFARGFFARPEAVAVSGAGEG